MDEIGIREVPDKFYYLNEDGTFNQNIRENKPMENAKYWADKTQQIGGLMLGSMGVLVVFLVVETDIFNFFWGMLWGA